MPDTTHLTPPIPGDGTQDPTAGLPAEPAAALPMNLPVGLAGDRLAAVREFVTEWAQITRPGSIELIGAADDERLLAESLAAGTLLPAGEGRYYSRSHPLDTARSEERTQVVTADPADRGVYNNWHDSAQIEPLLVERMRGASQGKTMYVVPYLMAPPGSPLDAYAAGVELTDDRNVVLQMIRMARVGIDYIAELDDPTFFVKGVHVTGDLDALGQGTEDDQRLFVTLADQRTIVHFGSAYGGNALLGKIAHGLRLASYDGWKSGRFLAEQFLLLGIVDRVTGQKYHVCGGFPSASGKTNLAMTLSPAALGDRYRVEFYGDDITWLWVDEDGRLRGFNPEAGAFGVAKDTNESTNPTAMASLAPGSGAIFTNVAYNEDTQYVWWEGLTPQPPADTRGWLDWTGRPISERTESERDQSWAHPNSRFTVPLSRIPNLAEAAGDLAGVVIDAVIFGGRTRDREPLIRVVTELPDAVYDGLTLGAEATFAAEGVDGQLRYDPMSMRPFMSYGEGDYAAHWLDVLSHTTEPPAFAHVNWFQRDAADGHYLWPGYRENLRALLWLIAHGNGTAPGHETPVGVVPDAAELDLGGLDLPTADLDRLLSIDTDRWMEEMENRQTHLAQFAHLPESIRHAHDQMKNRLAMEWK
ncbi:phosphoenolpyruvate carboxykinase (GTP) [Brevibacterium sp. 91QC2O2]|uniref:phosphoenolpyruvate carboxykinase (GTP) n=1 Tax=Brevibacterium sp. 91QC2O2 TaxID=2968458 RepID=UPI00211CEF04|nr:phosphoenolpyruvate carboxykinase (GTP) [Brevibacterium sp. 91QC2O2]MCQ9369257.1 phosphoenolpyruvate carboxykinase (GTP) [Brevibacterium sp. 91QC2O2]